MKGINFILSALKEEGISLSLEPYSFLPDPSLLEVPSMPPSTLSSILEKAESASPIAMLRASFFIDFLSRVVEKNREEERVKVLLFSNSSNGKDCFGSKEIVEVVEGHSSFLTLNGVKLVNNLFSVKGSFKIHLGGFDFEKELYGEINGQRLNISRLNIIMVKHEEGVLGWKEEGLITYSNPLLALAYSLKLFGKEKVGGIIAGNKFYINPILAINDALWLDMLEKEQKLVEKLYINERYNNLKFIRNSLLYAMNFNGRVKDMREKLNTRNRWLNKEVIISKEIFDKIKNKLVKGVDYYLIENTPITKLVTVIQALLSLGIKKEIVLKYTPNSLSVKANIGKIMREATFSDFSPGDVVISYKFENSFLEVIYKKANADFLTFSEKYLITKIGKNTVVIVT